MIFINNEDIQGFVEASKYLRRGYTEILDKLPLFKVSCDSPQGGVYKK
jgi:hypothetical protein